MKKNKKAMLGFVLASITALSMMQGLSRNGQPQAVNNSKQQVAGIAGFVAGHVEDTSASIALYTMEAGAMTLAGYLAITAAGAGATGIGIPGAVVLGVNAVLVGS